MRFRSIALASVAALLTAFALGCSADTRADDGNVEAPVTDVPYTAVKDQSTGNCWIYATTGWTESLVKAASGKDMDLSESYVTYWHWFDQIVTGQVATGDASGIIEGGFWGHAGDLMLTYGTMNEKDFIPEEANMILSQRQADAVKAINIELKTGALKTAKARKNRTTVRQVLDKAWALDDGVRAQLDKAFGANVSKTISGDYASTALPDGVTILKVTDLPAKLKNPTTGALEDHFVADAIGTSTFDPGARMGALAWQTASYPADDAGRRDFVKRVQRALNDHMPVVISWYVDFNALDATGHFLAPPDKPGRQGGHLSLLFDYQVENVPGFGTLPAGTLETRPDALAAALSDDANVTFLRIKNSWSPTYHPLPAPAPGGYHDLYFKYLNGPIQQCDVDADDNPKDGTCHDYVPLDSVVLPAGY